MGGYWDQTNSWRHLYVHMHVCTVRESANLQLYPSGSVLYKLVCVYLADVTLAARVKWDVCVASHPLCVGLWVLVVSLLRAMRERERERKR